LICLLRNARDVNNAVEMGSSHNKGPNGGLEGGLTRDFERQEKSAQWMECLYGSSMRGTWRAGSFTGNPES